MKCLKDAMSVSYKNVSDMSYAYKWGDSGIYVKRVNIDTQDNSMYSDKSTVELFYLNSKGGETKRQCITLTFNEFCYRVSYKIFNPISQKDSGNFLLPPKLKLKAIKKVSANEIEYGLIRDSKDNLYIAGIKWGSSDLSTSDWTMIDPDGTRTIYLNRSSKGWSVDCLKTPGDRMSRIMVTLLCDLKRCSKEELMEYTV